MREYREEVVRDPDPPHPTGEVVEEQVVETPEGTVRRVERHVDPPVAVRRSWWRRPTVQRDVVSTEYYDAPAYAANPFLVQFFRMWWFLLALIEAMLAIRFLLALLGANPNNGFAQLVYGLTSPLVAPFRTLFATPAAGESVFELYTLVAMLVWFLVWWVVAKLVAIVTNRPMDA